MKVVKEKVLIGGLIVALSVPTAALSHGDHGSSLQGNVQGNKGGTDPISGPDGVVAHSDGEGSRASSPPRPSSVMLNQGAACVSQAKNQGLIADTPTRCSPYHASATTVQSEFFQAISLVEEAGEEPREGEPEIDDGVLAVAGVGEGHVESLSPNLEANDESPATQDGSDPANLLNDLDEIVRLDGEYQELSQIAERFKAYDRYLKRSRDRYLYNWQTLPDENQLRDEFLGMQYQQYKKARQRSGEPFQDEAAYREEWVKRFDRRGEIEAALPKVKSVRDEKARTVGKDMSQEELAVAYAQLVRTSMDPSAERSVVQARVAALEFVFRLRGERARDVVSAVRQRAKFERSEVARRIAAIDKVYGEEDTTARRTVSRRFIGDKVLRSREDILGREAYLLAGAQKGEAQEKLFEAMRSRVIEAEREKGSELTYQDLFQLIDTEFHRPKREALAAEQAALDARLALLGGAIISGSVEEPNSYGPKW